MITNNISNSLTQKGSVLNDNPFNMYIDQFKLTIDYRDFIDPTLLSNKRISDLGGNGGYGESRRNDDGPYRHDGIDMLVSPGNPLYAPTNGLVSLSTVKKLKLVRVVNSNIDSKYRRAAVLYVDPVVKNNQRVKQGQLIGYSSNISVQYNPTVPNHTHIRIESFDYIHNDNMDVTDPTKLIFKNGKWQTRGDNK
jgi:murein DD-endopeptidase MepM/ murein hydrolase activator NlpD